MEVLLGCLQIIPSQTILGSKPMVTWGPQWKIETLHLNPPRSSKIQRYGRALTTAQEIGWTAGPATKLGWSDSRSSTKNGNFKGYTQQTWIFFWICFSDLKFAVLRSEILRKTYTSSPFAHRPLIQSQSATWTWNTWNGSAVDSFVSWSASARYMVSGGQVLPSHGRKLLNRGTLSRVRCQLQSTYVIIFPKTGLQSS